MMRFLRRARPFAREKGTENLAVVLLALLEALAILLQSRP
jgi:hypothetical protein